MVAGLVGENPRLFHQKELLAWLFASCCSIVAVMIRGSRVSRETHLQKILDRAEGVLRGEGREECAWF